MTVRKKRQAAERLMAGEAWQDHNLVFCHENGAQYTRNALRFSRTTVGHKSTHVTETVYRSTV